MANRRKSFPLRIDPKLYDEIRRLADRDLRSVNAQIEFLLRDAVRREGRPSASPLRSIARDSPPGE